MPYRLKRVAGIWWTCRHLQFWQPRERGVVTIGDRSPASEKSSDFWQLRQAHRRENVGQAVVVAQFRVILEHHAFRAVALVRRYAGAMRAQPASAFGDVEIIGGDHAAFAG